MFRINAGIEPPRGNLDLLIITEMLVSHVVDLLRSRHKEETFGMVWHYLERTFDGLWTAFVLPYPHRLPAL
jgi:hypothetical protein